jgi:arylformamidase
LKIIDLTKTIESGMPVYPGDPQVELKLVHTYEQHSWQLRELKMGTHTGTHVDAFSHMHPEGKTLDEIPLNQFMGEAQVVSVAQNFPVMTGLFFTEEAGLELLDKIRQTNPPFVGGEIDESLERALLKEEIVTYTNLVNLNRIPKGLTFTFIGLPLKIKEGDGSPVRAIAIIGDEHEDLS